MTTTEILDMAFDDVQSIVTLGTNSDILKSSLNVAGKLADTIQPFIPLISTVFVVVSEVMKIYENAKHNKKICASLLVRVSTAKINVEILQLQPRICDHKAFYRFVEVLKKIKNFMSDVSNLSGWKKYATTNSVQETFAKLVSEFDQSMNDLHFTITISNEQQRKLDQENLNADFKEMKQFLKKIAGGVTDNNLQINTIINELQIINEKVDLLIHDPSNTRDTFNHLKAIKINPKELDDLSYGGIKPCNGKSIVRKLYRGNKVACKPTNIVDDGTSVNQKIQAQLVILGKLKECPNILKFYGLSNLDDDQVMVFEWADKGNLRELYLNQDIDWVEKVHIALDICRGLVFLHSCDILHHDIRCENIMMTLRLEPKIANFKYSRETEQNSTLIENVNDFVRWMAPEKMSKHRYNFRCEIFSFGMLIWELAFEKFPYEDISGTNQIIEYVLSGNREKTIFGPTTPENQKPQQGLKEIITAAWEGNPQNRIRLAEIFLKLETLSLKCNEPFYRTSLYPDGLLDLDGSKLNTQLSITSHEADITEMKSLEEGIAAHKNKDYEKAWKIFELHSDLGNSTAKYWKARYLADGVFVNKDITQAASLFKEAAEDNNTDACFRYALMMSDKNSGVKYNREKFIKYLTKAADAGNAMAQYNLGDMHLKRNLSSLSNTDLGIKYLKLAALNGHSKAVEVLKEKNININE